MALHPEPRVDDDSIEKGILARLKRDGALDPAEFADLHADALDRLRAKNLIRDLSDGRIGISIQGFNAAGRPVPRAPEVPAKPEVSHPVVSDAAVAILRQLAAAGGEKRITGRPSAAHRELREAGLVESTGNAVALTPQGVQYLERLKARNGVDASPAQAAPPSPSPVPPPVPEPASPVELDIHTEADTPAETAAALAAALHHADHPDAPLGTTSDDCLKCRALDFLLEHAPALRTIVEHFVEADDAQRQLEADKARLADWLASPPWR